MELTRHLKQVWHKLCGIGHGQTCDGAQHGSSPSQGVPWPRGREHQAPGFQERGRLAPGLLPPACHVSNFWSWRHPQGGFSHRPVPHSEDRGRFRPEITTPSHPERKA